MGILRFYYDKIIQEHFFSSEEKEFLLNEWEPSITPIESTKFYENVSKEIMETFKVIYEKDLRDQIWKVVRALRRIILKPDDIHQQFKKLCEINQTLPEQRTPEWYAFRENLITASSWGNVLGYIGSPKEVILQKCGHEASQFKGNEFTRWGTKYEPVATSIYEKRMGKKITDFGCLRHPNEENFFLGASPDGIAEDGVMLEIKCPPKRIIGSIPTNYYWAQMQGQLEICDLEQCDFLECKLLEYDDEESYQEDINMAGDDLKTNSFGMESGVVLTFKKGEDLKFIYSDFFLRGRELTEWQVKHIKENRKMDFIGASYWQIVEYHCKPVFRDREWFAWAREQLKLFYDQWQFYKKHGYDSLLTDRQVKPKSSGIEDTHLTDYAGFTVTSEEGGETEVVVKKLKKFGFSSTKKAETEPEPEPEPEQVPTKKISFGFKSMESNYNEEEKPPKKFGFSGEGISRRFGFSKEESGTTEKNQKVEEAKPVRRFGFSPMKEEDFD